jgi:cyclic-di-GMP-binding biofilm dispersal mediator protein
MNDLLGKNILVIGASGVLGAAITQKLLEHGAQVMATTSSNDRAAAIPSGASPRLLLDLANQTSVEVMVTYLTQSDAQIDGVVNAAGLVAFGAASDLSADTIARLTAVNLSGPINLISGVIPNLKKSATRGAEPFILNISGVVAESPMANMSLYSATKAGLWAFDQALSRELRKDGIRVLDARPGHTETGLAGRAIAGQAPNFPTGMSPDLVATRIVTAILNGETDLPSTAFTRAG